MLELVPRDFGYENCKSWTRPDPGVRFWLLPRPGRRQPGLTICWADLVLIVPQLELPSDCRPFSLPGWSRGEAVRVVWTGDDWIYMEGVVVPDLREILPLARGKFERLCSPRDLTVPIPGRQTGSVSVSFEAGGRRFATTARAAKRLARGLGHPLRELDLRLVELERPLAVAYVDRRVRAVASLLPLPTEVCGAANFSKGEEAADPRESTGRRS